MGPKLPLFSWSPRMLQQPNPTVPAHISFLTNSFSLFWFLFWLFSFFLSDFFFFFFSISISIFISLSCISSEDFTNATDNPQPTILAAAEKRGREGKEQDDGDGAHAWLPSAGFRSATDLRTSIQVPNGFWEPSFSSSTVRLRASFQVLNDGTGFLWEPRSRSSIDNGFDLKTLFQVLKRRLVLSENLVSGPQWPRDLSKDLVSGPQRRVFFLRTLFQVRLEVWTGY